MQLGLTFRFLFLTILFFLFIGFEAYITIWPVVSEVIPKDLMDLVKYQIFFRLLFFIVPVIFVIAASSIVFSHRIAGPIYRFEQTLDKLIKGEDTEYIQLRKGDELKGLAVRLNELIGTLGKSKNPMKKGGPPPNDE
jgi:signal transduction histidine kinase